MRKIKGGNVEEQWKTVPNFPKYEINEYGVIKRKAYLNRRNRLIKARTLKPAISNGYLHISLCVNNKIQSFSVHRLLALTFLGPCPKRCVVRHLDGVKLNNKLSNLKYGTYTQNMQDAVEHGTIRYKSKDLRSLNLNKIKNIRQSLYRGLTCTSIAKQYQITPITVSRIKRGLLFI